VLSRIVDAKGEEIARLKREALDWKARAADAPPPRDFAGSLADVSGLSVIAEVKRRSPGAGAIDLDLDPVALSLRYARGGARALSILTDGPFFQGSLADLIEVRAAVAIPCLRKEFILDPIQVYEARAAGADAILLIVRILEDGPLRELRLLAEGLGMGVLVEAHDGAEVDRALESGARILGINNRDLATFHTDLQVTLDLLGRVPAEVLLVSESGVRTPADAERLAERGVDAVLVGEALVRDSDPEALVRALSAPRPVSRRA
jgi:indole-3-glycerol phosphate synthase